MRRGHISFLVISFFFALPAWGQSAEPAPDKLEPVHWRSIANSQNSGDFCDYLATFPNGIHADQAQYLANRLGGACSQDVSRFIVGEVFHDCVGPSGEKKTLTREAALKMPAGSYCGPSMVMIPTGKFLMGDITGGGESNERPVHAVSLTRSFAVGIHEVTQKDWRTLMNTNPSAFRGDDLPVERVSWFDAKSFVQKLSAKTGQTYRLLTESEWEYVARAKTDTAYYWGALADHDHANYGAETCCSGQISGRDQWLNTSPVGSFAANDFGVYDMLGNVWEWVEDCRSKTYKTASNDATAWKEPNCVYRVIRGGAWNETPANLRVSNRIGNFPKDRFNDIGFRIARDLSAPRQQ